MAKVIKAIIDEETCIMCTVYDGCDPDVVGYPLFNTASHPLVEGESARRCIVEEREDEDD